MLFVPPLTKGRTKEGLFLSVLSESKEPKILGGSVFLMLGILIPLKRPGSGTPPGLEGKVIPPNPRLVCLFDNAKKNSIIDGHNSLYRYSQCIPIGVLI